MAQRTLLLVLVGLSAFAFGCRPADQRGEFAIVDSPPSNVLRVTIQRRSPSMLSGGSTNIVVAVARDGLDAYSGDVAVSIDPIPNMTSSAITIGALETTGTLVLTAAPDRKHGNVSMLVRAIAAKDSSRSGDVASSILVRGVAGSLDTSFAADGIFVGDPPNAETTGVAAQFDGKIVLGGRIGTDAAVMRLNGDGSIDATFGAAGTGIARLPIADLTTTHDVVVASDGSILLGGNAGAAAALAHSFIARFSTNGVPDASFGAGGVLASTSQSKSRSLIAAGEGVGIGVFLGGQSKTAASTNSNGMHVLRLLPTGDYDTAWGAADGIFAAFASSSAGDPCALGSGECFATAMSRKGADRVTLCASRGADGVVFREIANGSSDPNYELAVGAEILSQCTSIFNNTPLDFWAAGARKASAADGGADVFAMHHFNVSPTGGLVRIDPNWPATVVTPPEAALGPSTRAMVAAGGLLAAIADSTPTGTVSQLALVRITTLGQLDPKFGDGKGYVTTPIGTTAAHTKALLVQADLRIVVVGTNGNMVVARYWQ